MSLQAYTRSGSVARPDRQTVRFCLARSQLNVIKSRGFRKELLRHEAIRVSCLRRIEADDAADGQLWQLRWWRGHSQAVHHHLVQLWVPRRPTPCVLFTGTLIIAMWGLKPHTQLKPINSYYIALIKRPLLTGFASTLLLKTPNMVLLPCELSKKIYNGVLILCV